MTQSQGLYRLSGVKSKYVKIVADSIKGKQVDFAEEELVNITSALKHFFRELPEPLLTFEFHQQFVDAASTCWHYTTPLCASL